MSFIRAMLSHTCLRKRVVLTTPGFSKELFFCDLISANDQSIV
jgi:hypothetical protein